MSMMVIDRKVLTALTLGLKFRKAIITVNYLIVTLGKYKTSDFSMILNMVPLFPSAVLTGGGGELGCYPG